MKYLLLVALWFPAVSHGATNSVPDCAQATVQTAINGANDGDVVRCPEGTWSWSDLNLANRNITLQGAGIGRTKISVTAPGGIEATSANTKPFRVTGFTFSATGNFGIEDGWAMVRVLGGKGWRFDHNRFEIYSSNENYNGGNGIYTRYDVAGLIDHNEFVKGGGVGCVHAAVFPEGTASTAWEWSSQIHSSERTVVVEDNYFHNTMSCASHNAHAVYGNKGGIFIARRNTIYGMNIDAHGFCGSHGAREFEISGNKWLPHGHTLYSVLHIRGGTGVIYDNDWSQAAVSFGYWLEDYRAQGYGSCSNDSYFVPGFGNVTASQTCPEGYPCAQQIGRGQNHSSDPLYIWGNAGNAATNNGAPTFIKSGRDYFINQGVKPGYTAFVYPHPLSGTAPMPPTDVRVIGN